MRTQLARVGLVGALALSFTFVVAGQQSTQAAPNDPCVTPTATPTATATATPTPTPEPTATPTPTPTPEPTATPTPTPTPEPTATPTPTPTPPPGPARNVAANDPCVTPTATPTIDAGSGGSVTTTIGRGIPRTGSNPSPFAPIGLAAVLLGVALLGVVSIRRARPGDTPG